MTENASSKGGYPNVLRRWWRSFQDATYRYHHPLCVIAIEEKNAEIERLGDALRSVDTCLGSRGLAHVTVTEARKITQAALSSNRSYSGDSS